MAQLKEGSIIKKSTGDEIIATETQLNNHNTDVAAHSDIRQQINTLDANKVDNSRVLTDVPLNAKFTDTVTTINGKTGAITKADIVALGIPAQDTVVPNTRKVNNKALSSDITLDKSDIGLGNVDNAKQMPIAGGTFTGIAVAQTNISYTTRQLRNVILSTEDPSGGENGDIWIKYTP